MNKNKGFTLAEVLITLGIIGVVAAMTIPALVNKYQEKVTVTKVKKMFSTLSNTYELAKIDLGDYTQWELKKNGQGAVKFRDIMTKNLKILKKCDTYTDFSDCGIAKTIYQHPKTKIVDVVSSNPATAAALLADGSALIFLPETYSTNGISDRGIIYYDINGLKEPNTAGVDYFNFYVNNKRTYILNYTTKDCYENGFFCISWLIYKGNMDYLKCNGLTWEDTKCP